MKTDLQKIMSIAGYPGLFFYLSQSKSGIIVESLIDGKRMCATASMRITSLSDVAIYTDTEELPLRELFLKIKENRNGEAAIDAKSDAKLLQQFFEEVVPDYDRERFYASHMKKVLDWYNLLQQKEMLDFVEPDSEQEETDSEQ